MRTLSTQVRLRRLVRAFSDGLERLLSEPQDHRLAAGIVLRLQELSAAVQEAWNRERAAGPPDAALAAYVGQALKTAQLAIAGPRQQGAALALLARGLQGAAPREGLLLRGARPLSALGR